jgi:Raf kinase inhibitor-like YbhB/YbcL family protein
MELTSTAFRHGGSIPKVYTCDGSNYSPPLTWKDIPDGTRAMALTCEDPDAPNGTFVHWVIFNISPDTDHLDEHMESTDILASGAVQGKNDFGLSGYGGPCPPLGTHRYIFKLFALDEKMALAPGIRKDDLLKAMEGHILAQSQLLGTYNRN